jgi:hypothetical protein
VAIVKLLKTNVMSKTIVSASEMSNLVGMFALLVDVKSKSILKKCYIKGKASNKFFLIQAIGMFGTPNVCKLITVDSLTNDELGQWYYVPDNCIDDILDDYYSNGNTFRYEFDI